MKKYLIIILFGLLLADNCLAIAPKNIFIAMPYTVQAPDGKWSDLRFEDGCEETSVLMAVYWAKSQKLTKQIAKEKILSMAEYETRRFKNYHDTSIADTASRLLKGYFSFNNYVVKKEISSQDIINELVIGRLVIVPTNGQALHNPNFKQPGPDRHMLVIKGYDFIKQEFITNDPGTKKGEGYRYKKDVLFKAIRDYPTGHKKKIIGENKIMIVVFKSNN